MKLSEYIRSSLNVNFISLVKKDKCEICGKSINLQVHHINPFAKILDEVLYDLKLELKDKEFYSDNELKLIRQLVFGKHFEELYVTVCDECHKHIHIEKGGYSKTTDNNLKYFQLLKLKKENQLKVHIDNKVIPILDYMYVEKHIMLILKDRKELVETINVKSNGKLLKSLTSLNNYFILHKIPYRIIEFSTSKMINGKQKKYPSAWRIEKLSINKITYIEQLNNTVTYNN